MEGRIKLASVAVVVCLAACAEPPPSAWQPTDGSPYHLDSAIPSPDRNPMTTEGIALGRALFYDPLLSGNNEISCGTCHEQSKAFSDGEVVSDAGVTGEKLLRHTMTLMNLAWMDGYFWDGGGFDLESQAFGPLQHVDEMAQDLNELMNELAGDPVYPGLFEAAFDDGLTLANVVRALAQFERTLVSANSPYDRKLRGEAGVTFSDEATAGLAVFETRCAGCHGTDFFSDFSYRNNGLDSEFPEDNLQIAWGYGRITQDPEDIGKYKVPTLRNVAVTAPYMHDGRFATLKEVIGHYRSGVQESATLDVLLRGPAGGLGLPISDEQESNLLAFLETLTDDYFLSHPAFGPPAN